MSATMSQVRQGRAVSPRPPGCSGAPTPSPGGCLPERGRLARLVQFPARGCVGSSSDPAALEGRALSRPGSPGFLALCVLLLLLSPAARADEIRLRDGTILSGKVLSVQANGYVFRDIRPSRPMQTIPKATVQTVFYDDPAQADRLLGIRNSLRLAEGEPSFVRLLPTRPFGKAILAAIQNARTSIWVSAYYISGSSTSPIKDFYAALAEKARQGLDVVVVSEYGPGTSARVREATYNFARELERSSIRVLFMSDRRILHKKMILVDGRIALLGSANLTMAGTLQSDEMNVAIRQPAFVARMRKDFEKIMASAQTAESANAKENK